MRESLWTRAELWRLGTSKFYERENSTDQVSSSAGPLADLCRATAVLVVDDAAHKLDACCFFCFSDLLTD